jgi:hypothetical protein
VPDPLTSLPNLPPALAVGALYDSFLQAALRQFFARATFETEPMLSASSDGRLAIEPTEDPAVMYVRWFGTRYGLRVSERRPFTAHEIRMARAIGSVLAARYHAILNPRALVERGELFRGAIEDRYTGAFADGHPYPTGAGASRADRIASAIEVLRVAALSSYENRAISSGVLILGPGGDARAAARKEAPAGLEYSQALTGVKSFFRLVDGQRTLFLTTHEGRMVDIVDVRQWSSDRCGDESLPAPVPSVYEAHARATLKGGHVCVVLSPSHEIKVFAEGAEVLAFRHAHWHLLDLQAKFQLWADAVGQRSLATRLFQTALELANARQGALFVVMRDPRAAIEQLISTADRVDAGVRPEVRSPSLPTRRDLLNLLTGRAVTDLEPSVLAALASLDGATVTDAGGALIAAGAILRSAGPEASQDPVIIEGARTTAALAASRFGPVLKVSEDGAMTFYDGNRVWDL